jgi:hypothetical protein
VERWRGDCGCNAGRAGWRQQWRGPLRDALDWLRDRLDPLFEARAGALLKEPWAARDDYVLVLLSGSAAARADFLARHQLRPLSHSEQVEALKLLELQRQRLLVYTSCGWFFDEMSGIETVQVLRYAARAIQLASQLGGADGLEDGFLERLRAARSNLPELQTGDVVYRRHVLPAVVDLRRVIAHYAITAPWEGYGDETSVYAFTVTRHEWHREAYGETSLSAGRVRVVSDVTTEVEEAAVAVLHFGGHDFHGAMRGLLEAGAFTRTRRELFRCFAGHSLSEVVRALDRHFEGRGYGIRDVFLEERRHVLAAVTEGVLRRFEETYRRLYGESRRLMEYMRDADAPAPEALALAARYVLQRELERLLPALAETDEVPDRVREVLHEARGLGLDLALERQRVAGHLERALLARMARLWDAITPERVESVILALRVGRELHCGPDLWAAQNRFFELWQAAPPEARAVLGPLGDALGFRLKDP